MMGIVSSSTNGAGQLKKDCEVIMLDVCLEITGGWNF